MFYRLPRFAKCVKKGGKNIHQQLKARPERKERKKKGVGEVLIGGIENGGAGGVS